MEFVRDNGCFILTRMPVSFKHMKQLELRILKHVGIFDMFVDDEH
jgi:hypothetical protein